MLFKEDIESCINLKLTIKEMKLILDEIIDNQNRKGLFDSYARIKYYDFLAFHSKNKPFLCDNIERVIVEPCIELDEETGIEKYFMIIANHQTKTFNVGYIRDDNYCLKKEYCYSFPWSDDEILNYNFSDVLRLIERYIKNGFKPDSTIPLDPTLEGKSFFFHHLLIIYELIYIF